MKKIITIEIETIPKRFIDEEKENLTDFVDRTLNNAICQRIRNLIEDEDFESDVMSSEEAGELPQKIDDFCAFGSVKITTSEKEEKPQRTLKEMM